MTAADKKTGPVDAAVEAAAHAKLHAIDRLLSTEFALMDAQNMEDKHHSAGKSEGDAEYDAAVIRMEGAFAARDDAIDDLILAEFAFRAASKRRKRHQGALDKTNAGGAIERLQ